MKKKVFFRADAGNDIGYGHFIRSLALADMLKNDFDCTFFTQCPNEYQKKEAEGVCNLVSLPADESSFGEFLKLLHGEEIIVLDNYFFTSEYQKEIKDKGCKLVCIDDIHNRHFYADVIINHCINSCNEYDAESETKFFLGAKWALLRAPFLNREESQNDSSHWVITFGGSDPLNLTLIYVEYLRRIYPDAQISIMVGDGYSHLNKLRKIGDVRVYSKLTAKPVADLFRSAGNVICSASTVCYEALSCGCKVYAGYYVDNQVGFYKNLVAEGLIFPLGNLLENDSVINIKTSKQESQLSFTEIAKYYRMVFHALCFEVVKYQNMTVEQSRKTWKCRNTEAIRKWMTNPEPFSYKSHCSFIASLNENPSKIYYSFFDGEQFIGSYNFVGIVDGDFAERGLFVNPDYQGKHVANMMEYFLEGEIVKRGVKRLIAEVLKVNDRSYKYHLHVGYKVYKEDDKNFYLERFI